MLLHGAGFRDYKKVNYWGRIPKILEQHGTTVYYGRQDCWGTIEYNAGIIKDSIDRIIQDIGCEKLNLIAHSKGGLEARYLISTLGMADKIASLTTIATPHHGSKTLDKFYGAPVFLYKSAARLVNLWFRLLGDQKPDFFAASRCFSTYEMNEFNMQNPDSEHVFYQSYAAVMRRSFSDMFMVVPHFVVKLIEGENDGLVTPASAAWTNFRGVLRGSSNRGISHLDEIDVRRTRLAKHEKDGFVTDICNIYVDIVSELKHRGF
jgi:triacylglycerol lipase